MKLPQAIHELEYGHGSSYGQEEQDALIEVLPVAENLEFFKNMDVLDAMDFLENSDTPTTKGTT